MGFVRHPHAVSGARLRRASISLFIAISASAAAADPAGARPPTPAEESASARTRRHEDILASIDAAARAANVKRIDFGRSVEGRPLAAAIIAPPELADAGEAGRSGRIVALILGSLHAGEWEGREASLGLIRDLAADPAPAWLDRFVLIVVPDANPDGNDRIAAEKRPLPEDALERMARRANAQGLDLDRDFVKLECPETRALVSLIARWDPHLLIDIHAAAGSAAPCALSYLSPRNPAAPPAVRAYLRDWLLPSAVERLRARGGDAIPWTPSDAERARSVGRAHEPRHAIEYLGLRGRMAILAEAQDSSPFEERIRAIDLFVRASLESIAADHRDAARILARARREAIRAGRDGGGERIPIRTKEAAKADPAGGLDVAEAAEEVDRPFAYAIPFELSRLADRLRMHGIRLERLEAAAELEIDVDRIERIEDGGRAEPGRALRRPEVTRRRERRRIPRGSYLVRLGQPLGTLAAYLLEPRAEDGLLAWGFLDPHARAGRESPVLRIPSPARLRSRPIERVEPAQRLDLDQIFGPEGRVPFEGSVASVRWLPKSESFLETRDGRPVRVDAVTGAAEPLIDIDRMARAFAKLPGISESDARRMASLSGAIRSDDGAAAVVPFSGDLYFHRFGTDEAIRLTRTPEAEAHATIGPRGDLVAFVRDHNIWLADPASRTEWPLTTEGTADLLCGELDWVYQEEVYGRGQYRAYWWSPDGRWIAFLRLDESAVPSYTVMDPIPIHGKLEVTRYPKAGDPLPVVALGIARVAGGPPRWVDLSDYEGTEIIIVRVGWTPDGAKVVFQVQDRVQTWLDLRTADPESGRGSRILRETSPAWVDVLGEPVWLPDGSFLWLSERTGWCHIWRVSADGKEVSPLTSGAWEVQDLLGADPEGTWVYFTGLRDSSVAPNGYRVRADGTALERITRGPGSHSLRFNDAFTLFADTSSDLHTPPRTDLFRSDGTFVRTLSPNLVDHLPYYRLSRPEFLRIDAGEGHLEAILIRPPDFDPTKKYPVLCPVYGGPDSPTVWDRWGGSEYLWYQFLAQEGIVIWKCDNRSASTQGKEPVWKVHKRLGTLELEDIERGLRWLREKPWVDPARIGIFGWSYGGYVVCFAMTHSRSFRLGIAGAPVTDWRNYDAIYTERFLGHPRDAAEGYRSSSAVEAAADLSGRLFLIHGAMDDNVHLSNTLQFAHALQRAGKPFDLMVYPRDRHGVSGRHIRDLLTRAIRENL